MTLCRREATELARDIVRADASCLQQRSSLDELHARARRRHGCAAALGIERHGGDSSRRSTYRQAHEIAAGSAPGRAHDRTGGDGAPSDRLSEMLLEAGLVHAGQYRNGVGERPWGTA
jgi:hypothetical protein